MTAPTANSPAAIAVDDVTALSLLVTAFNNPKITDSPLPDAIQLQAAEAFKRSCAVNGVQPTQKALAVYLLTAWAGVSEIDKIKWMGKLVEVCKR
jgi:hypothetical protein